MTYVGMKPPVQGAFQGLQSKALSNALRFGAHFDVALGPTDAFVKMATPVVEDLAAHSGDEVTIHPVVTPDPTKEPEAMEAVIQGGKADYIFWGTNLPALGELFHQFVERYHEVHGWRPTSFLLPISEEGVVHDQHNEPSTLPGTLDAGALVRSMLGLVWLTTRDSVAKGKETGERSDSVRVTLSLGPKDPEALDSAP